MPPQQRKILDTEGVLQLLRDDVDTPFDLEDEEHIAGYPENLRELLSGSTMWTDSMMGGSGMMLGGLPPECAWSGSGDAVTNDGIRWKSIDMETLQAAATSTSSLSNTGMHALLRAPPSGDGPGGARVRIPEQPCDKRCGVLVTLLSGYSMLCNPSHLRQAAPCDLTC